MKEKTKDILEFIKRNCKWIVLAICLMIFTAIFITVNQNQNGITKLDVIGYNLISTYLINDTITPIIKFITWFGGVTGLIALGIILTIVYRSKVLGVITWINLSTIALINQIIKRTVQRPRPIDHRFIDETGFSFPSGHSMASLAFYGLLIYLINKKLKNIKIKILLTTLLCLLIILIGTSRIYLGVHYTSDVIAGFSISISYLMIFTSIINNYIDKPNGESNKSKE